MMMVVAVVETEIMDIREEKGPMAVASIIHCSCVCFVWEWFYYHHQHYYYYYYHQVKACAICASLDGHKEDNCTER